MVDADATSFEGCRKRAKRWLKAIRSGDAAARAEFDALIPRCAPPIGLRQVQHALARELGFASWASLKEHFELETLARADSAARRDEFLNKACLSYRDDWPSNWRRAERILARYPELAQHDIYTAVVCGELERVRALLTQTPSLASRKGGPRHWEPLLFLCYGRLPTEQAAEQSLAIAKLLLNCGADPNAHWLWVGDGSTCRFSALTGAMGQGELGQPEHPRAEALARLLLERGADANDSQGLYDTCLRGDETRWLELLFEFGLDNRRVNWTTAEPVGDEKRPGNLDFLAAHAASTRQMARLEWLLAHGADPNARSSYTGKSCYETALLDGQLDMAGWLLAHGATMTSLAGQDAITAAIFRGDRGTAERLLREHPEYLQDSQPLVRAASQGHTEAVRLLLEFGMDANRRGHHSTLALNSGCKQRPVCELLLAHGADPRGRTYGGTAAGWALHGDALEMARFLAERSRLLLDAVMVGHVALALELLAEDPACVNERSPSGATPLHCLPEDLDTAERLMAALLESGADPKAVNDAGQTPSQALEATGRDDVAASLDARLRSP